jgi:hypothetical protein
MILLPFHAKQLQPWMPTVQFGMEVSGTQGGSFARQGSGNVGAQAEYDLHTKNNGFNTGGKLRVAFFSIGGSFVLITPVRSRSHEQG